MLLDKAEFGCTCTLPRAILLTNDEVQATGDAGLQWLIAPGSAASHVLVICVIQRTRKT